MAQQTGSSACTACSAWESPDKAATGCSPNPQKLVLLVTFPLFVGAFCVLLVHTIKRRLTVVDVSLDQDRTIVSTFGPHGFSNFNRLSFPVVLHDTGHPGLDSPSEPLRARVKDAARLELLTWTDKSISKHLDTSMGTLVVGFPHDLCHQGWPLPRVVTVPLLFVTVVGLGGLAFAERVIFEASLGAAAMAVVCTVVSAALRAREHATPLMQRLSEFKKHVLVNHHARSCEKGPNRAITVGDLHKLLDFFHEFIRDRTAYYLTSNLLIPLTKATQLSYAELVGPGQVEWFVSHFWGTAYEHFCMALQKHAETIAGKSKWKELHYWVCFCSNNQHSIEEELGGGWEASSFYLTLKSGHCKGTCMVLDDEALPLTRAWCIFELMQTVKLERNQARFEGLLLCTSSGLLNTGSGSVEVAMALAKRVAEMDLATAQATVASDAKMIRDQVIQEMGSFGALNRFLCGEVHEMLVRARQNTNEQFTAVLELLNPASVAL